MNYLVRNPDGVDVAKFLNYRDAHEWTNSQGAGYPIVREDA